MRPFLIASGLAGLATLTAPAPATAHFQLLHGGASNLAPGQGIDLLMVFTHPFAGGPTMEMGDPEALYLLQSGGEGEPTRTDLMDSLEPLTFQGAESEGAAWRAEVPGSLLRGLGDYVFVLEPAPYFEAEEGVFIQQFTKFVANVGGVPGAWAEPVGLPTEIVPLDKPYGVWAGGIFRGVVMSEGEPVPFAEVEVEYMNFTPDAEAGSWSEGPAFEAPAVPLETISLLADANGTVTVALPRAGWWGIGALGVGPVIEHEGQPLSQDAVIWVEALPMPE